MKSFVFWIELPHVLCVQRSDMSKLSFNQASKLLEMGRRICSAEKAVSDQLSSQDFSNFDKSSQDLIEARVETANNEKAFICCQSAKLSINILNEFIKEIEAEKTITQDIVKKVKVLLKLTRLIAVKCDEEIKLINFNLNSRSMEFFIMIKTFIDKVQAKLVQKSNEIIEHMNFQSYLSPSDSKSEIMLGHKRNASRSRAATSKSFYTVNSYSTCNSLLEE